MDFRQYSDTTISSQDKDGFQTQLEQEAKKTMNKYANYSQQQLVDEFLTVAKQQIERGEITKAKLQQACVALAPYITKEQQVLIDDLLEQL